MIHYKVNLVFSIARVSRNANWYKINGINENLYTFCSCWEVIYANIYAFNMLCKISYAFYKLTYFTLSLGLLVGMYDINCISSDESFVKIEDTIYELLSGKNIIMNYFA